MSRHRPGSLQYLAEEKCLIVVTLFSSFSESSHVAYQIKADDAGSNMVANILPTDTPSTQGVGSKGQTISFSESSHVAYQIKGN